jgi:hypothetical protein
MKRCKRVLRSVIISENSKNFFIKFLSVFHVPRKCYLDFFTTEVDDSIACSESDDSTEACSRVSSNDNDMIQVIDLWRWNDIQCW